MRRARRTRVAVVVASVLLIATVFTVVASVATGSAGAAASALDNFECYSATSVATAKVPAPFPATPKQVSLRNAVRVGRLRGRRSARCRCTATRRARRSCPAGTR